MVKPIPVISGDISAINWRDIVLAIVGFWIFYIIVASLFAGVAFIGVIQMVGLFIMTVAVGLIFVGKIPLNVFLGMFILGLVVVVLNPAENFTMIDLMKTFGLNSIPLIAVGGIVLTDTVDQGDDKNALG
ncbi:MAG: hypothetical protein ACOC53_08370 [Candidatus Saliniplasma sp.]